MAGMPSVTISFTEAAKTVVQRGERGIIAMIIRDTVSDKNPFTFVPGEEVPSGLSDTNKKQIELATIGYVNKPLKIIVCVIDNDAEDYSEALDLLETEKFDYLVCPSAETDQLTNEVVKWIKLQNENGSTFGAVLPNAEANCENIVNFTNSSIVVGDETYTAEQYCSRIAGILAGTPLTMSATYAELPEVENCDRHNRIEMDEMVNAGKIFMFWDGEKVKLARAVNSLTAESGTKGNQFKKIKIIDTINLIKNDIKRTAEDSYLGKYANTYDNKCLLISAISNYLKQMVDDGILTSQVVEIDIAANKAYLRRNGVAVEELSENDIKTADTSSNVFIKATINIPDAIEDITIDFTI